MFNLPRIFLSQKYDLKRLYDRQLRIEGLDQERISGAKIGIIGVGATGSHSAIYSAHVGIGYIRLCDFDEIEAHNVPRMIGVTLKDVGRNKAEALAKAIRKIGNGTEVEAYKCEARYLPKSFFKDLDLAIVCVDRISTRFEIGEILWLRGIPHIDVGIREFLLNVMEFLPQREDWPCIFCMRQIIPEEQMEFSNRAKSCNEKPIPTILPPGAIASAIAVNEALKVISNFRLGEQLNNFLQVDLRSFAFLKIKIPKDKNCPICGG
jgi:molybdopterin/thiamine biosynthesis adenylyltransferase